MRLKKKTCDSATAPQSGSTIRAAGQRTLQSTRFLPRSDTSSDKKPSPISLSEYLARKLHSTQEKQDKAPLSTGHDDRSSFLECGKRLLPQQAGPAKENGTIIDDSVFKQFRHATPREENDTGIGLCDEALTQSSSGAREQESRKRKNPFTGRCDSHPNQPPCAKKHVLIIGDDPKPRHRTHGQSTFSNKRSRPLFNHYGSGKGEWDCEREGFDSDEVGYNEAWEGMTSTTLGELHWH